MDAGLGHGAAHRLLRRHGTPDGKFTINESIGWRITDGDYKIDAWHPRFADKLEQTLHVKNGSATVHFQFDGAKSF